MADNERVYVIEGKDYPSVTTILGATIAKQNFLIPWGIKGYHEQVLQWVEDGLFGKWKLDDMPHGWDKKGDIIPLLRDARDALMEARDVKGYRPAKVGDVVHHIISQSIYAGWDGNSTLIESVLAELDSPTTSSMGNELREMFRDAGLDLDSGPDSSSVFSSLTAWQRWLADFGIAGENQRFVISDTEKLVYHRENHVRNSHGKPLYAGTVDLILTDKQNPRRKYLIDIKTGSLYADAMYQVAAYANAYNDISVSQHMDGVDRVKDIPTWGEVPSIDRCFILQLQREKSKYILKEAKDWYSLYRSGFAKANEWFLTQKEHTLGRQLTPSDFQGEKAAVR